MRGVGHRYPVSNSVGRPSSFQPEYVDQVERLCRTGAIDTDIAEFFNVAVSTVYEWKNAYPEFSEPIKRGKAKVDREVADKLMIGPWGRSSSSKRK
ncbi:helix-turn-helix domain-containing protein [Rhizobium leguminosarum]|nr:helix-turn-helix domain-containing protein [Rhizobium leguminosarum]